MFGSLGMTLLFLIGQGLFLARHLHDADTGEKPRTDMLYAIIARDIPASQERRLASRPAHLARLEQLKEEGRLVTRRPAPGDRQQRPGRRRLHRQPDRRRIRFAGRGAELGRGRSLPGRRVYAEVVVKPFKKVLP